MKFFDEVHIKVASGAGGDGVIAGRREKHVPYGGPAGGDGGHGGSVIFVGDENEWTLMPYRYKVDYRAAPGEPGGSDQKYGKKAEHIELSVPLGTIIKDRKTGELLAHITTHGERYTCVAGGRGGLGNMHFTTPQHQYPQIALLGEPGHKRSLTLELQMLADVALVGTPSVGKSSLINTVTKVKAKTADYHFTTLVPNLGVVQHKNSSFTIIDVPGLIAGASEGVGLGNQFLRHILKSRILAFVIDTGRFEAGRDDFGILLDEFVSYTTKKLEQQTQDTITVQSREESNQTDKTGQTDKTNQTNPTQGTLILEFVSSTGEILMSKAIMWILNKHDLLGDDEIVQDYVTQRTDSCVQQLADRGHICTPSTIESSSILTSAATRYGCDAMLDMCMKTLSSHASDNDLRLSDKQFATDDTSVQSIIDITAERLPFLLSEGYVEDEYVDVQDLDAPKTKKTTRRKVHVWEVQHAEIAYLSYIIPRGNDEAELRYRRTMHLKGHLGRLEQAGARRGDVLHIISPYHGVKDRYIGWE